MSGFSHGNAGIAISLLSVALITKKQRFLDAFYKSIEYERTLFSEKKQNWKDLRIPLLYKDNKDNIKNYLNQEKYMVAWCHGATGIGMARLFTLNFINNIEIKKEVDIALNTTIKKGFGGDHSLCHGDLGNIDFLLQAWQYFKKEYIYSTIQKVMTLQLNFMDQNGYLCSVPSKLETPSLMIGLAGIGYELLRLAFPDQIPSVLILEPPKTVI